MVRGIKGTGKHGCCKVKGTDIGCANVMVTSSQIPVKYIELDMRS